MIRLEFAVTGESDGSRLDVYLAGLVPAHSRSQVQRLIRDGLVRVGARPVRANTILQAGDPGVVEVPPPSPTTPVPAPQPLSRRLPMTSSPCGEISQEIGPSGASSGGDGIVSG